MSVHGVHCSKASLRCVATAQYIDAALHIPLSQSSLDHHWGVEVGGFLGFDQGGWQ